MFQYCIDPKKRSQQLYTVSLVALLFLTGLVYSRVLFCDFVNYDDTRYITENPAVRDGITFDSLRWSFTTFHASNWHPLTWVSHLIDITLFGHNPSGHHGINLLFHVCNTLLLVSFFVKSTGKHWASLAVGSLFALHPLHVESVAWVAERKDVLSTFFGLMAMLSYLRYVKRPTLGSYMLLTCLFMMSLMSKPMLVTFPFILLLLDYWPLARHKSNQKVYCWSKLVAEKLPLLVISAISCVITLLAQKSGGALQFENDSFAINLANVPVSYLRYLNKMILPVDLAVIYPFVRGQASATCVATAVLILLCISVAAISLRKKYPFFVTGWLWFVCTLVPVIGLVRVGSHAIADRYTYVPLIGIFLFIVWGCAEIAESFSLRRQIVALLLLIIMTLSGLTWKQLGYWRTSASLFEHAIAVTNGNWIAHYNLGVYLYNQGNFAAAITHFLSGIECNKGYAPLYNNLGTAFGELGNNNMAIEAYLEAIRLNPSHARAHYNLAYTYFLLGFDDLGYKQELILSGMDKGYAEELRNKLPWKF
jgi:tetratricopeptide (TPR) repeat protein